MSIKYSTEYECYDCKQLFETEKSLEAHIWKHLNIRCLCCVCHKRFKSKQGVLNHRKRVHNFHGNWNPKWHCGICFAVVNNSQIGLHVENCLKRNLIKMEFRSVSKIEENSESHAETITNFATQVAGQHTIVFKMSATVLLVGLVFLVYLLYYHF